MTTENKQKIATIIANTHSTNKANALNILRDMVDVGNNVITDEQLAALYSYFTPNIKRRKPKNDFEWLQQAAGTEETRPYLHHLHSDGEDIHATDGNRLHILTKALPEGFYNSEGIKIDVDANYPDVKRVIPKTNDVKNVTLSECKRDLTYSGSFRINGICVINLWGDAWFQEQYVVDAVQGLEIVSVHFNNTAKDSPVLLKISDTKQAVIMPIKHISS